MKALLLLTFATLATLALSRLSSLPDGLAIDAAGHLGVHQHEHERSGAGHNAHASGKPLAANQVAMLR